MVLERQNLSCHTLSNNGPGLVTQSKITSTHLFPVLVTHRQSYVLRFSDALLGGSCKNNRNQTVTDAYQSDKVLAETQRQSSFSVIHGSGNPLDCSHQAAGLFRSRLRIVRVHLNQQGAQRTKINKFT